MDQAVPARPGNMEAFREVLNYHRDIDNER